MDTKLKILIVEDDPSVGLDLEMVFDDLGHQMQLTDNATTASKWIQKTKFDLIILDIFIKGPTNGIQFAEKIKDTDIPILFITAHKDAQLFEQTKNTNAIAFLVKPFDLLTLRSVIEIKFSHQESPQRINEPIFSEQVIYIKSRNAYHKVLTKNILWVLAERNYITIHTTAAKRFVLRKSLSNFHEKIGDTALVRAHKAYLVNKYHISKIDTVNSCLNIGVVQIPIGRTYKKQFVQHFKLMK